MSSPEKRKVLFLCTGNSARSILAEYLLRQMDPRFETYSAGAKPTGKVHPVALEVLRDVYRIDAGDATSKSLADLAGVDFDVVITVCDHARDACPVPPASPAIHAHWSSPDPAGHPGGEEEVARAFRQVARQIHRRLELFRALDFDAAGLAERIRGIGHEPPA